MVFPFESLRSNRRWQQRAHRAGRVCAVILGIASLCVLVEWQREAALARVAQGLVAETGPGVLPVVEGPGSTGSDRPQYRHSVVMGGVYDRDDVARAVHTDPTVDDHYRDIDVQQVRAEVLSAPRRAYVSYRIGHRVFWTRKPVTIQAGETVLSDGTSAIRARCGNRISDVPMEPTSAVEPAEGDLDEPIAPPLAASAMPLVVPFFPGPDTGLELDGYPLPVGGMQQLFPFMGVDDDPGSADLSVPGGPGGGTLGFAGNPPGGNPPGGDPPGGDPPGGDPPGGDPPGGDPPGGDPPCCGIPPIDTPPDGDPPPSVPEPGPLVLLAVGFAAVAVQRLLSQRHEG